MCDAGGKKEVRYMEQSEIQKIYSESSRSERFLFAFGLFPERLAHLNNDELLQLMELSLKEFKQYPRIRRLILSMNARLCRGGWLN